MLASEKVLHALIEEGWTREDAYSAVQAAAKLALQDERPFVELLAQDAKISAVLDRTRLEELTVITPRTEYVDEIYKRLNILD